VPRAVGSVAANQTKLSFPRRRESSQVTGERKQFCVYILASRQKGALYIGITSDLPRRVWQHKTKAVMGHSARYGIDKLAHFEVFEDAENAIRREKAMKKWNRDWKVELIEQTNPNWCDLYETLLH